MVSVLIKCEDYSLEEYTPEQEAEFLAYLEIQEEMDFQGFIPFNEEITKKLKNQKIN